MNEFDLVLPDGGRRPRGRHARRPAAGGPAAAGRPSWRCWRRWSPPASAGSRRRPSSPRRRCRRWPTPTRWPRSCPAGATCTGRRWWPTPAARCAPSTPGSPTWSTWSRRPTGTAAPTPAAPPPRRSAPSARSPPWPTAPGGSLEVIIATAWDCPFDGRTPIARTVDVARAAVTAGADQLCLGDTIGTTTPLRVVQLLDAVRRACPGVPVGVHFHDTRGTGQANALAAVQAGVTQLDSSVGGLGGCPFAPGASGNIATEELVYLLEESGVRPAWTSTPSSPPPAVTEQAVGHELPSSLYRAGGRSVPRGPSGLCRRDDDSRHECAGRRTPDRRPARRCATCSGTSPPASPSSPR